MVTWKCNSGVNLELVLEECTANERLVGSSMPSKESWCAYLTELVIAAPVQTQQHVQYGSGVNWKFALSASERGSVGLSGMGL